MRSIGIGRRSTLITSMINCTLEVSTQASFRTARISQVKWLMTLLPHSDSCNTDTVSTRAVKDPVTHDPAAIWTQTFLFMMMRYLRGLRMATHQSYVITDKSTHSVEPMAKEKYIWAATPWEWDGVFPWNKVCQHWSQDRSIPDVQTWQVAEEVHVCV